MKIKNVAISIAISVFCLTAAPVFTHSDVVWAAKGGISVKSAPRTAPAMTKPASNTGNTTRQAPKSETGTTNTRQQAKTAGNGAGTAASQTSRWGNTLRNIGFLAGGMFEYAGRPFRMGQYGNLINYSGAVHESSPVHGIDCSRALVMA